MKLAPLLAQFLYRHKRLDLPGIGSFLLDPSASTDTESHSGKPVDPSAIRFENATIRESPDLVTFIAERTGKLKALAAADLDSHLELVLQFLNIGKPFLLEGIGSLVKIKSGQFAFTSGEVLPESMKDYSAREISSTSSTEETFSDYRKAINVRSERSKWRRPVVFLLAVAGLGLAIWGGYTVYKMTSQPGEQAKEENIPLVADTARLHSDSTEVTIQKKDSIADGTMKFVLEKAGANRAFQRFADLRSFHWPVQLETKDSVSYTLFMKLPATYSDTARICDSLFVLSGKKVSVELAP